MSAKPCNLCGAEVDFNSGGAAILMAFCRGHSTTLTNVAYCGECYKHMMDEDLRRLSANCGLMIDFGDLPVIVPASEEATNDPKT